VFFFFFFFYFFQNVGISFIHFLFYSATQKRSVVLDTRDFNNFVALGAAIFEKLVSWVCPVRDFLRDVSRLAPIVSKFCQYSSFPL